MEKKQCRLTSDKFSMHKYRRERANKESPQTDADTGGAHKSAPKWSGVKAKKKV